MNSKLAITCGDPAGVGPEIIASWLRDHPEEAAATAVIGPAIWLDQLPPGGERISVGMEYFQSVPGKPDDDGSRVALAAMERAAAGCKGGVFHGVVTGPVSKAGLAKIGFEFPGQTEFFAKRWGGQPTMAFCGGQLRVVLATWHIPLRDVPSALNPDIIARTVVAARDFAEADAGIRNPRIGVCGLNPHAGEEGLLGTEERDLIEPVLARLRRIHTGLSQCQPADTLFGRALGGEFDVVVALYHDQGLAPLKTIDFNSAVNVTLGLPFVRTSPDHGTAYDIAGRKKANATSFTNAVAVAKRLIAAKSA